MARYDTSILGRRMLVENGSIRPEEEEEEEEQEWNGPLMKK